MIKLSLMVWLAAAIPSFAVLLSDDFESDSAGSLPAKAAFVRPGSPLADAQVLVVNESSNVAGTGKGLRLLDDNAGEYLRLGYDAVADASEQLSALRVDFAFAQLKASSSGDPLKVSVGEYGKSLGGETERMLDCRLYDDGTVDFRSSTGPDSTGHLLAASNNTLSIFINDLDSTVLAYTGPDRSRYLLPTNSVAYWLNGSRIMFGGQGHTLMENINTAHGTVFSSTNNIGRFGIIASTGYRGLDYVIDNLRIQALPLPIIPVPKADSYVATADTPLVVGPLGVLDNDAVDTDSDGDGFLDAEEAARGSGINDSDSIPSDGTVIETKTEFENAVAGAVAGDIIVVAEGTYPNLVMSINPSGAGGNPIIIRSRTVGAAVVTGTSTITINGDHVVLDGFHFTAGKPNEHAGAVRVNGSHNRVKNCSVVDFNGDTPPLATDWLGIYGTSNRVDHCYFEGKEGTGPLLTVWRSDASPNYHRIDHNVFKNYAPGGGNGFETIRIGTSTHAQSSSFTTVEYNYFENCDGEIEIISNKSCNNTYRGNTFYRCNGQLTLRQGNSCLVEGNVFLADRKNGCCGIRVIDKDHVVRNNYIQDVRTSASARGGLIVYNHNDNAPLTDYWEVKNVVVSNNSIINCRQSMALGVGSPTNPPTSVSFVNNMVRNNIDGDGVYNLIREGLPIQNPSYSGDIFYGSPLGISPVPSGIDTTTDPNLVQNEDGLWLGNDGKGAANLVVMSEFSAGPNVYAPQVAMLEAGVGGAGALQFNADGSFTFTPAPGFTGQATFTYHIHDGANTSEIPATVTIDVQPAPPAAQYDEWHQQFPELGSLTNMTDDYEPDGIVNLLEYALGGNPASNDAAGLLPASGIATDAGINWLVYIYKQRTDAAARGLTYHVLSGNDLVDGGMTNAVPASNVSPPTNGFKTATHRIPADREAQQFMGLKVRYSE